jgi:hypothetical protein
MPHDKALLATMAAALIAAWVLGVLAQKLRLSPRRNGYAARPCSSAIPSPGPEAMAERVGQSLGVTTGRRG